MQKLQTIKSQIDAYGVAQQIVNGMQIGETISANAISFHKVDEHKVAVNGSEYNYRSGQNEEVTMYAIELADFILFPERKRINDALDVIEIQLAHQEAKMQSTTNIDSAKWLNGYGQAMGEQYCSTEEEVRELAADVGAAFLITGKDSRHTFLIFDPKTGDWKHTTKRAISNQAFEYNQQRLNQEAAKAV